MFNCLINPHKPCEPAATSGSVLWVWSEMYSDSYREKSPKSQTRVQDASDESGGLAGSSAGADALRAAGLVELCPVQAPRAGGVCLPWSWELKFSRG